MALGSIKSVFLLCWMLSVAAAKTANRTSHGKPLHVPSTRVSTAALFPPQQELELSHRRLQRPASGCTDYPTPFNTSLVVYHAGFGEPNSEPFTKSDLDALARQFLITYNLQNSNLCDPTFRTVTSVSVQNVVYTTKLEFIRLQYDFQGSCQGCLNGDGTGTGPLFGDAGRTPPTGTGFTRRHLLLASANDRVKGTRQRGHRQLQNKDNKGARSFCQCSDKNLAEADMRGMTALELVAAMNAAILAGRESTYTTSFVSGVESIQEIMEVGPVLTTFESLGSSSVTYTTCLEQDTQDFDTSLFLEYAGTPPTALTAQQGLAMSVALMESYNELNFVACDNPFFRTITSISYKDFQVMSPNSYRLHFEVLGKCVNCDPTSLSLFSEENAPLPSGLEQFPQRVPSKQQLQAQIDRSTTVHPAMKVACVCPVNPPDIPLPMRAPTAEEYKQVLQATQGVLAVNVGGDSSYSSSGNEEQLVLVSEVSSVECSSDLQQFTALVSAQFDGNPSLLQPTEINALEGGFLDTYNQATYSSCDQYFRTIGNVKLYSGGSYTPRRRLQTSSANTTSAPSVSSMYRVSGTCRGCPVDNTNSKFGLFDDGFRIRRLRWKIPGCKGKESLMSGRATMDGRQFVYGAPDFITALSRRDRQLQASDSCTCPSDYDASARNAPTTNAFTNSYNTKITQLRDEGLVKNVNGVKELKQLPRQVVSTLATIYYGEIANIGTPLRNIDFAGVANKTSDFFSEAVRASIKNRTDLKFWNLVAKVDNTAVRDDLNMIQVDYTIAVAFVDSASATLPTASDINEVMQAANYLRYLTKFVWLSLPADNHFRHANMVRYAEREARARRE